MRRTELRKLTLAMNMHPWPMDHEVTEALIAVMKTELKADIWKMAQLVSEQVQNARKVEGKE